MHAREWTYIFLTWHKTAVSITVNTLSQNSRVNVLCSLSRHIRRMSMFWFFSNTFPLSVSNHNRRFLVTAHVNVHIWLSVSEERLSGAYSLILAFTYICYLHVGIYLIITVAVLTIYVIQEVAAHDKKNHMFFFVILVCVCVFKMCMFSDNGRQK